MQLLILFAQFIIAAALVFFTVAVQADEPALCNPPNILLIITDDQRYDSILPTLPRELQPMPETRRLVFGQGVEFSRAYVPTPLCCPSRSSIFTGRYASHHGVTNNDLPLKERTLMQELKEHGYFTGLIGKYLNSWDGTPRLEFDFWVSYPGGNLKSYYNPVLNVQGTERTVQGYSTDLFGEYALEFIAQAQKQTKPFFLLLAFNAPHRKVEAAERHAQLFAGYDLILPPSFGVVSESKPRWNTGSKKMIVEDRDKIKTSLLTVQRALRAVDENVALVLKRLESSKVLDETMVIFLSDNGVMRGEHNLIEKDVPYEEAVHVPMAIRYSKLIAKPRVEDTVVANIDLAPTIYDLTCMPPRADFDGISLVPLLRGEKLSREGIILEGRTRLAYIAFHTGMDVLIDTKGFGSEYYDLKKDPFQLKNLVGADSVKDRVKELQRLLRARADARSK